MTYMMNLLAQASVETDWPDVAALAVLLLFLFGIGWLLFRPFRPQ